MMNYDDIQVIKQLLPIRQLLHFNWATKEKKKYKDNYVEIEKYRFSLTIKNIIYIYYL